MGDTRPLRILFVGLGAIGQRHVRNLRQLLGEDLELTAVRVRGRGHVLTDGLEVEAQTGLEERYRIRVVADLDTALAERPDAVFVTNPSSQHMEVALQAARAGCNLFVEKPLATLEQGIDELARLVDERKLVALVGFQLRFHPGFERMRALLSIGRPGRVVGVRAVVGEGLAEAHPYEDYRESYAARAELGGGALLGLVHEFDYLQAWFGRPRRLFALGGQLSRLEMDVEDVASVLMEFEAPSHRFPVHVHMDYVQRPPVRSCEVLGDDGRIVWDQTAGTVEDVRGDGSRERFDMSGLRRNELFRDEIGHFVGCLRGRDVPRVGVREASTSVRMALAARRSLETGDPVTLS
jgi:predicted dehydrogenase